MLRDILNHLDASLLEKTVTIPNIPLHTECVPAPYVQYPSLRVLYSGRFAPVKNVPMLARAVKRATEHGAELSMIFVGDGPERAECEKIVEGMRHVRFMGQLPANEVVNLLSEADLYVMPSLSDICPNGVLEAIGCGVPALITSEHGLPKEVRGLVEVDPMNEEAWTEALVRLANHPEEIVKLRSQVKLPPPSPVTLRSVLESIPVSLPR
jgi:glycosyltransferase involved in cell wall biosynthesis